MRLALAIVLLGLAAAMVAPPLAAQTTEELLQQLEAERAINEQLRARVRELEEMVSGVPPAPPALQPLPSVPPVAEAEEPESTTAIREALISRGVVVLPPGSFRLALGTAWTHTGADTAGNRIDSVTGTVSALAGLPWETSLSVTVPYAYRDTSFGTNTGFGDLSFGLTKQITTETETAPSFLFSVGYLMNIGMDAFRPVPIGSGFPVLSGAVLALKSIDPVALYGNVSYSHVFPRQVTATNFFGQPLFEGRIAPGAIYGYRLGLSLAATPDITVDASLSGAFVESGEVRPTSGGEFSLSSSTLVFLNLGSGFLLSRNLSLLLSASAGVTKDSPDFTLSASLPYRF